MRCAIVVAAGAIVLGLAGCSGSGSGDRAAASASPASVGPVPSVSLAPGSVPKEKLEAKVSELLTAKDGAQFATVCPSALNAVTGTELTCVSTKAADGSQYDVSVIVDSVVNQVIHFALNATQRS